MAQTVKVTILGTEYPLRSNDEALTMELATELDSELRDLQTKLPAQPTTTLAVLTALNLSEHSAHARLAETRELARLTEEIDALSDRLQQALEEK